MIGTPLRSRWSSPSELRDAALLFASFTYALGYGAWAMGAHMTGFGHLPALDAQYFVAGAIPAFMSLMIYAGIRIANRWLAAMHPVIGLRYAFLGVLALNAILLSVVWSTRLVLPNTAFGATVYITLFFMATCAAMVGVTAIGTLHSGLEALQESRETEYNRVARKIARAYVFYVGCALVVGGLLFYAVVVYPYLPHEFGGLKPRPGRLDYVVEQVSPQTHADLGGNRPIGAVTRSSNLSVIFETDEYLVVEVRNARNQRRVLKVQREVIRAIYWVK